MENYLDTITIGDALELCEDIPDESIDLILCDPDYRRMDHYAWLAKLAERVLKEGGSVVAQTGHIYRFDAEKAMDCTSLIKRPILIEHFTGGWKTIWMHKALRANTPFIWLEKGDRKERGFVSTAIMGSKDKSRHAWGDGGRAYAYLIERLTKVDDFILDPFTGSGTVPVVCVEMGRHFIAFEINEETGRGAQERLRNAQPPLLQVPEPKQLQFSE